MSWLPVVVTAPPAAEPATVDQVKAQTKIDASDDDTYLAGDIAAARVLIEKYTGLKLITQTAVLRASCFADLALLPTAPIGAITGISYLDPQGALQTLSTDVYEAVLIGLEPAIRLKVGQSWPALRACSDAVQVTATCGYGADGDAVPSVFLKALLVTVAAWYGDREGAGAMPPAAELLLVNDRLNA